MAFNTSRFDAIRPRQETILWGGIVITAEILLLLLYVLVSESRLVSVSAVRYYLYPFVWINVGLWALARTTPQRVTGRKRQAAIALTVGYFLVLLVAGGLVGPGMPNGRGFSLRVLTVPPGWGPVLSYSSSLLTVNVFPYKVVGYVALAYLVYATMLDAAGSAVSGILGLLSCVSCTWPVLASVVTGLVGSGTAIAGFVYTQSYGLSTVVFLVTVGLLHWRPFGQSR
jgi:hypothetical protein